MATKQHVWTTTDVALDEIASRRNLLVRETPHDGKTFEPLFSMWGLVEGVPLAVQRFETLVGARRYVIRAALVPPLDLGLHLQSQGTIKKRVLDLVGVDDHLTGDADFDRVIRVGADEGDRTRAILGPSIRAAVTALDAASENDCEIDDAFVTVEGHPKQLDQCVFLVAQTAAVLRAEAERVPVAEALRAWEPAARALATAYDLRFWPTPLSLEGSVGGLDIGVVFRRSGKRQHGVEVGCVVDPAMRYELEIAPKRRKWDLEKHELMKPIHALVDMDVDGSPLDADFDVRASPLANPVIGAVVPLPAQEAMIRLSERFDVVLRYGILTLSLSIEGLEPSALSVIVDEAIEGARTIVPAIREGYRAAGRR